MLYIDAMRELLPGDTAPWFQAPALNGNPRYAFDTAAGRPCLMLFLGASGDGLAQLALATLRKHRAMFDDHSACFFGISCDPADRFEGRIRQELPGIRWILDDHGAVSALYGATGEGKPPLVDYRPFWLLLDRTLRVAGRYALSNGQEAVTAFKALMREPSFPAPVLVIPRVLEPSICRRLITLYNQHGGEESGFMREENGKTVLKIDPEHKRRADYHVEDASLQAELRARISRFLLPPIRRAFQFEATRIERWLIACYDGNSGGHFRPHRDNTTKGTAHRKFACTINLNSDEYEGGDLCFPEFGPATYRAPTGGAVIFSCSILHEARAVTAGRRYAFLPFLYDEEGAAIREKNRVFLAPELRQEPERR
jgi:predicted 2-oxoglutarate/Fe(II)-dependent dioxygenase YbiX/peroxiredoxin